MKRQNRKRKLISLFTAAMMIVATLLSSVSVFAAEEDQPPKAEKIEVMKMPDKLEYMSGEVVDLTGATIKVTFDNKTTQEIIVTKENRFNLGILYNIFAYWENSDMMSNRDLEGKQQIIISMEEWSEENQEYKSISTEITVDVKPNPAKSIAIKEDADGKLLITVTNEDNSTYDMKVLDYYLDAGDPESGGEGEFTCDKGIFRGLVKWTDVPDNEKTGPYHTKDFVIKLFPGGDGPEDRLTSNSLPEFAFGDVNMLALQTVWGLYGTDMRFNPEQKFEFYQGKLTENNIDKISATVFEMMSYDFYGEDRDNILDSEFNEELGMRGYTVKAADMEEMIKTVFDIESIDFSLSKNYDENAQTIKVYILDGWGGNAENISSVSLGGGQFKFTVKYLYDYEYCKDNTVTIITTPERKIASIYEGTPEVDKLSISKLPTKIEYKKGEELDLSGLELLLTYMDGTSETVTDGFTTSGYDKSKEGKQTITVQYKGQSTTFDITVTTSSDSGSPVTGTDSSGISFESDTGVVPEDTQIVVKPVEKGNANFTIINNALEHTSNKWVAYDITLMSQGVTIQPNGKVKITMPVPSGFNKNKMVLYRIEDDGTKTKLDFTLDKNKKNIVFETDHFSLYVVAEEDSSITQPPKTGNNDIIVFVSLLAVLSLGMGIFLVKRQRAKK